MIKKTKKKVKVNLPVFDKKSDYYHTDPQTGLEKLVMSLVPDIAKTLGLCNITYYMQTIRCDDPKHFETEGGSMILSINYVKHYKTAYLNLAPGSQKMFDHGEKKLLARALVHELSHIVTSDLGNMALDRVVTEEGVKNCIEETTESVAQIARKILEVSDPKNYKL